MPYSHAGPYYSKSGSYPHPDQADNVEAPHQIGHAPQPALVRPELLNPRAKAKQLAHAKALKEHISAKSAGGSVAPMHGQFQGDPTIPTEEPAHFLGSSEAHVTGPIHAEAANHEFGQGTVSYGKGGQMSKEPAARKMPHGMPVAAKNLPNPYGGHNFGKYSY